MSPEPERTCVGCREKAPRGTLLRIAATPSGIHPDPKGSAPGRGCYLHRDASCARQAVERGAVGRALRVVMRPEEVSNLLKMFEEPEDE